MSNDPSYRFVHAGHNNDSYYTTVIPSHRALTGHSHFPAATGCNLPYPTHPIAQLALTTHPAKSCPTRLTRVHRSSHLPTDLAHPSLAIRVSPFTSQQLYSSSDTQAKQAVAAGMIKTIVGVTFPQNVDPTWIQWVFLVSTLSKVHGF
ncbi:hypothetical protein EI94DRAFT_1706352 [Lactarius quietus]|nr:hypothetical protein EI94DRAFT_1706352 [Lactarius quietus]